MPRLSKTFRRADEFLYDGPDADEPNDLSADETDQATAAYIADMAGQLEVLARAGHHELLAYLLTMARAEADTLSRLPRAPARTSG